jgi:hypothetical protein
MLLRTDRFQGELDPCFCHSPFAFLRFVLIRGREIGFGRCDSLGQSFWTEGVLSLDSCASK